MHRRLLAAHQQQHFSDIAEAFFGRCCNRAALDMAAAGSRLHAPRQLRHCSTGGGGGSGVVPALYAQDRARGAPAALLNTQQICSYWKGGAAALPANRRSRRKPRTVQLPSGPTSPADSGQRPRAQRGLCVATVSRHYTRVFLRGARLCRCSKEINAAHERQPPCRQAQVRAQGPFPLIAPSYNAHICLP